MHLKFIEINLSIVMYNIYGEYMVYKNQHKVMHSRCENFLHNQNNVLSHVQRMIFKIWWYWEMNRLIGLRIADSFNSLKKVLLIRYSVVATWGVAATKLKWGRVVWVSVWVYNIFQKGLIYNQGGSDILKLIYL